MWLADVSKEDEPKESKEATNFRSSSPPLEGGEAPCEFYLEPSKPREKENEEIKDIDSQLQGIAISLDPGDRFSNRNIFSLLGQELLAKNTFTETFLQSILSSVDSHDPVVANAWMETLLDVIDLLPREIIRNEILPLAINKGQMSQPIPSRLLCCRMLGKLCTKFDSYVIKKEVLPVVLSLSQDLDHEVRGCMCRQLQNVAKGLGFETAKSAILPELVELANDEESFVRLAGIETVVQMLPLLDNETCILTIIPLVQKMCEKSLHSEDSTLPVVAKQLGQLCHGLSGNLSSDQKIWFLKYYQELAKLGLSVQEKTSPKQGIFSPMPDIVPELENRDRLAECRWACAYNMPAMVLFAGNTYFSTELHNAFYNLCRDPFYKVVKTMASGFYEVVKILGDYSPLIMPELSRLLASDSVEVLKGIIPHLPKILDIIFKPQNIIREVKEDDTALLVQAIMCCEVTISISSNWRLHAQLLTQYSSLSHCLSFDIIFRQFVPLLLVKLYSARPIPCRHASAYSLLVLLRHIPKLEQRNGIVDKLIRDLCFGRSCHKRMLFFTICDLVLELFSKSFFKRHFFLPVLKLCDDAVPNIRLRLCAILPKLKLLIKLPRDNTLLQELESCVRTLMTNEKDRDVAAAVNKAIEELDKIEVPTELVNRRFSMEVECNLEDIRKEEEENELIEMEFGLETISLPSTPAKTNKNRGIPVRKSGTLPKFSKAKEFKSNTLTKTASQNGGIKLLKYSDQDEIPTNLTAINNARKEALKKHLLLNPSLGSDIFSNRPDSPAIIKKLPSSQESSFDRPKRYLNRCPSPVLPYKQIKEDVVMQLTNLSTRDNSTQGWNPLTNSPVVKMRDLRHRHYDASILSRRSMGDFVKFGTPLPSPEMSRRLSSSSSRIPTPSAKLPQC